MNWDDMRYFLADLLNLFFGRLLDLTSFGHSVGQDFFCLLFDLGNALRNLFAGMFKCLLGITNNLLCFLSGLFCQMSYFLTSFFCQMSNFLASVF